MKFQKSIVIIALVTGLFICGQPELVMHGRPHTLIYRGGGEGTVIFDHQMHASEGFRCADCHTNFSETGKILFTTQKQGLISTEDHESNTKCFACHNDDVIINDQKAPLINNEAFYECERCHRKN